ncbi:extracellular solute-binding protein [Paenibacillus sp. J2TS4]|uniref:extracellular solute-binding protein n=1 Tax=Paenibacillus sp. J2TS4 TaxID=2807194 RepID=UPI001B2B7721|nr:extracellular solute-binding protein [Paenibacillus sp. J2TS4]GIP36654.1 lipoprotein LipO [Paenibacillus sp. J2TS4]
MKRIIFIKISAILLLAGLTGCASNTEVKEGKPNPSGAAGGEQAPALRIGQTTAGQQYIEASPDINKDKYVEKIRELSGINIRIDPLIPWQDYKQKMNLLFAGGDLPDLLQTQGINVAEVAPAVDHGALLPLNDLIEEYGPNLKKNIPEEAWNSPKVSKDGKIYGIPQSMFVRNDNVVYVRKDWLDALGLENPTTVDDYIEMLRAFKEGDPNGNGKPDEIPYSGRANFAFTNIFFGAYDVIPDGWKYEDDQLVPNFIRPGIKDALEVYKLLYQEKLLDNEFMVQQGKDWDAKIKGQGTVGMWQHAATYPDKWLMEVQANTPSAEIVILPAPVGPDGKGGANRGSSVGMVYVIPKSNENPEIAIKYLDWLFSDEAKQFLTYGMEGQNYTMEGNKAIYKYPESQEEIYEEQMYNIFLDYMGQRYLENQDFMAGRNQGELIVEAMTIANNEGRVNDGLDMPALPTMQARPELAYDGLWMQFAAKVITGEESLDGFNKFVEDWKKRGGNELIKEATEWYKETYQK